MSLNAKGGARALELRLRQELQSGRRVLWLVAGGSNIPITCQIMQQLPDALSELLTIIPTDERYGQPGHPDSNVQQLMNLGFAPKQAVFYTPLDGSSLDNTIARYNATLLQALSGTDRAIGQLGIGADGHIAGILPHTPALKAEAMVTGYRAPDYTRVTITLAALRRLDAAYVFAYGDEKRAALERLRGGDLNVEDQPAQGLRDIAEVYIYNDLLEERSA